MLNTLQLVMLLLFAMMCGPTPQKPHKATSNVQDAPCPREMSGDLSQFDLDQCWERKYKKADARLNAVYRKLLDLMAKDVAADRQNDTDGMKTDETSLLHLRRTHRLWLSYRQSQCDAAKQQFEPGSAAPMVWAQCMVDVTNHRIDELNAAYEAPKRKLE